MKMKIAANVAAVAAIATGLALAQGPGFGRWSGNSQPNQQQSATDWRLERMSVFLNLTDSQKQQAKLIFDNAESAADALEPTILQAQTALRTAATSGKGDIDALAANIGALLGKVRAIHARAFGQFYNLLTPTQREQLDKAQGTGLCMGLGNCQRGAGMGMMGGGFGPGRRP